MFNLYIFWYYTEISFFSSISFEFNSKICHIEDRLFEIYLLLISFVQWISQKYNINITALSKESVLAVQ